VPTPLQLLDCFEDSAPDYRAVKVAFIGQNIDPLHGAEYIGIVEHFIQFPGETERALIHLLEYLHHTGRRVAVLLSMFLIRSKSLKEPFRPTITKRIFNISCTV
jgi:hypothetical protein